MQRTLQNTLRERLLNMFSHRAMPQSFRRVYGSEHELAVEFDEIGNEDKRDEYLQEIVADHTTYNGGRVYLDLKHLEACTPETSNIPDAIRYEKAMERYCVDYLSNKYKPRIYKISRDDSVSFGAHQNYLTKLPPTAEERSSLILFSVVEKLITGAGYQHPNGSYDISQRMPFIKECLNDDTRYQRPLLNLREERLTSAHGFYRFHHISNDPNMCEQALALKTGLWDLVLTLAENNLLPDISYDSSKAVKDARTLCRKHSEWTLKGVQMKATSVLQAYHDVMKAEFAGQDTNTERLLDAFGETITLLDRIEHEPYALAGKLDWVTKKMMIELCMGDTRLSQESGLIRSINLDYHRIDREGLFYQTQAQDSWIERWVTDREIDDAQVSPPLTRAWVRGKARQLYDNSPHKKEYHLTIGWERLLMNRRQDKDVVWSCELPNPAYNYPKKIDELEMILRA